MDTLVDRQVKQQEYQVVSSLSEDEALINTRLSYVIMTASCFVLLIVVLSCYVPLGLDEKTMLVRCTIILEQKLPRKELYFLLMEIIMTL